MARHVSFDGRRRKGRLQVAWFSREGRGWKRGDEQIEWVVWSRREVLAALRRAGFDKIQAHDPVRLGNQPSIFKLGDKTFYVARKASD